MADQILEQVREAVEGQIDFKGQHLAEFSGTTLLSIVGVRIIFRMRHFRSTDSDPGYLLPCWLQSPRYQARSRFGSDWDCHHFPHRRSPVAILQNAPCQMATYWGSREERWRWDHSGWTGYWMILGIGICVGNIKG
jgi:hypothetical protein